MNITYFSFWNANNYPKFLRQYLQTKLAFSNHSSEVLGYISRDMRIFIFCICSKNLANWTYSYSSGCLPHDCIISCGLNVHICICAYNQMQEGGLLRTKWKQVAWGNTALDTGEGQAESGHGAQWSQASKQRWWVENWVTTWLVHVGQEAWATEFSASQVAKDTRWSPLHIYQIAGIHHSKCKYNEMVVFTYRRIKELTSCFTIHFINFM